ncbi:MAG: putative Fe-S cluster assembly protein SufT [Proteobacteria bacterium]|nr:MAG: putative Fe-S cluster assembly protein SufT [Pseudomonadota bacterium]
MNHEEVVFSREASVIQIPDGNGLVIPAGTAAWVMQVLGGNFTVRLETGHLIRLDGQDADAIGREVPDEARQKVTDPSELTEELIWEQLSTVYDPEIPVNIVELGLIYGCQISDNGVDGKRVDIEMTLTAPGCGMGQILKDDVEYKVSHIPGVSRAEVELVFDPPWTPEKMSEAAQLELGFF